jgi:ATP-binding cassette subfamily C protein
MRLLIVFARAYPWRSAVMLVSLLLAAIAEGVGLSSMLPLLDLVTEAQGKGAVAAPDISGSTLERVVVATLAFFGVEPRIGPLLLLIVGGITVKAGLVLIAKKQVGYTVAHVATDLRLAFIRALLSARWPYYVSQPAGVLANAFATEAQRASEAYLYGTTILSMVIETALVIGVGLMLSWKVCLAGAAVGVATMFLLNRLVRVTRRAGAKQTMLQKLLLARLTDVLYAVKPLKAMSRETLVGPLLERETERLNRALQRQVLSKEALRALQEPLLVGSIAGGLYAAVVWWALPLDNVILLALLFGRALNGLNKVQKQYQAMAACDSAYWSLRATIERSEAEHEPTGGRRVPTLESGLAFDDVHFSYANRPVLSGATFTIPAGRITALIGASGAGKTTVVDMIIGLVRANAGKITIDGVPLGELDLTAWRRMVGYVPQEAFLLHESVLINVTLGDQSLSEADAFEALEAAGAWDFVAAMPEGIHTPLGERGARVSGGQRQRIAIARALVHRPRMLILDEATASLDQASEAAICQTVSRLRGRMTIVAVSHQTALLEIADVTYRVADGTVLPVPAASRATRTADASRA